MIGYIYLITDTTNGKQYVGQHHYDKEELDTNYHGSGHIIKNIYNKRPETLKEEYLKTCFTQTEMDEWEKYFIFVYNTLYPNGYNLEIGGRGGVPSEEVRRKMSEAGKIKHFSEEHKMKLSESLKGRFFSEEWRLKLSESLKGKHKSEEHRCKLSESVKKTMTPEHRKRLSEIKKEKNMTKTVSQFTKDFVFVMDWSSLCEIERQLGYEKAAISRCCLGKQKTSYGYIWKYKD